MKLQKQDQDPARSENFIEKSCFDSQRNSQFVMCTFEENSVLYEEQQR